MNSKHQVAATFYTANGDSIKIPVHKQKEKEDFKTLCCKASYAKLGRARWICVDCKKDCSLEFVLIYAAVNNLDL